MFSDIVSRVPIVVLEQLKSIEFECLESGKSFARLPAAERNAAFVGCGCAMVARLLAVLEACTFVATEYCYKHRENCPLMPRLRHGQLVLRGP